jgi:hypothetical protein
MFLGNVIESDANTRKLATDTGNIVRRDIQITEQLVSGYFLKLFMLWIN